MSGFFSSYRFIPAVVFLALLGCADAFSQVSTPPANAQVPVQPTFLSDGTIVCGQTRLVMRPQGTVEIIDNSGNTYTLFLAITFKDSPQIWNTAQHLKDLKIHAAPDTKTVTLTGQAMSSTGATPPCAVQWRVSLTPEGLVRSELAVDTQSPMKDIFAGFHLIMSGNRKPLIGHQMKVDQETLVVGASPADDHVTALYHIQHVLWNADQSDRAIGVRTMQSGEVALHNGTDKMEVFYDPSVNKRIVMDIQLPADQARTTSPDTYGGIDFWASDQLRMPQYDKCRNLVQNPGFEAGFQYWRWNSMGQAKLDTKHSQQYDIVEDPTSPGGGGRCLALRGEVGQAYEMVSTFGLPVEPDQTYTLSFYAKTDKPGQNLSYVVVTGIWGVFPAGNSVNLTDRWQRFTKTFKAPNHIVSLGFGNHRPTEDCWMYVDAVQIEKGDTATDYVHKPIGAFLESDARGNCWQPGTNPHARLRLYGKPASTGRVTITQEDFFGQSTDRGTLRFTLDNKGQASLPLPWAAELNSGIYIQRLDYQTDDGFMDREYARITVLPFQNGANKNKNIFSLGLFNVCIGDWDRLFEFLEHVGIGSGITFDPQPHKFYELLRKHNILYFVSIFDGGEGFFKDVNDPRRVSGITDEQRQELDKKQMTIFDQRGTCRLTDEQLHQVEEQAYQKAAAYPEVQYWKLNNEPPIQLYIDNREDTGAMVQVLRAARRGALRANPNAKILSPDPSSMYPNSGTAFINTLLEASAGDPPFDIAAIHPYRPKPEEPDLDRDTQTFLSMLNRNKFKGDVWFTEGIYHNPYIIPLLDLNTHCGCSSDHYRGGDLSYAMGWGERMAAAYTARSWLVALKYSDRVKLDVDWGFWNYSYCDVDLTPHAVVFAANTLERVLGNAVFKSDLILADNIRCYVFQDEKNQPVAAIWSTHDAVDRGRSPSPMLHVSTLAAGLPNTRVINFMGDSTAISKNLRVGPFPQFLVGPAGSMDRFLAQLGMAVSDSGGELFPYLALKSADQVQLVIVNSLGRAFKGKVQIIQKTHPLAQVDLAIPPRGQWTWTLPQPLADNQVNTTDLTLKVVSEAGKEQSFPLTGTWMKWPKRTNPIIIDGDLSDWAGCFHMPLTNKTEFPLDATDKRRQQYPVPPAWKGPDDLSAELYATWDEQNLYLAFKVRDDVFNPGPSAPLSWQGDGLQIYFDGWADARSKHAKGYDSDDQAFMVWPNTIATAAVFYREFAPERQLAFLNAGIVETVKIAMRKTVEGFYIYEMAIPVHEIQPIKLQAFEKFGFGCLVNDADNDYRKRILTITPAGTEPARAPDLYPTVILTK